MNPVIILFPMMQFYMNFTCVCSSPMTWKRFTIKQDYINAISLLSRQSNDWNYNRHLILDFPSRWRLDMISDEVRAAWTLRFAVSLFAATPQPHKTTEGCVCLFEIFCHLMILDVWSSAETVFSQNGRNNGTENIPTGSGFRDSTTTTDQL